jgi:hypothetical protein
LNTDLRCQIDSRLWVLAGLNARCVEKYRLFGEFRDFNGASILARYLQLLNTL